MYIDHHIVNQNWSKSKSWSIAGYTSGFPAALSLMSVCLLAQGFHNSGTVPNPQDLAPKHSGTVFGVMNGIGCIPGSYLLRLLLLLLLLLLSETEPRKVLTRGPT